MLPTDLLKYNEDYLECKRSNINNKVQKLYIIEDPSIEVNQTVKSPPQTAVLTSDTRHRTGDDSTSTAKEQK